MKYFLRVFLSILLISFVNIFPVYSQDKEVESLDETEESYYKNGKLVSDSLSKVLLKLYKANKSGEILSFIENNLSRMNIYDELGGNEGSILKLYIKTSKELNQFDDRLDKIVNVVVDINKRGFCQILADICLTEKRYDKIDRIYKNFKSEDNLKYTYLDFAITYSVQNDKAKMMEQLKLYFDKSYYVTKNQVMVLKEFEPFLDDDEFLKLMKEDSISFAYRYKGLKYCNNIIDLDKFILWTEEFKNVDSMRQIRNSYPKMDSLYRMKRELLNLYKRDILKLIVEEKSKLFYKLQLAGILLETQDPFIINELIQDLSKYSFHEFVDSYSWFVFQAAQTNPKDIQPLLRNMLTFFNSKLPTEYLRSYIYYTFFASEPFSYNVLYDSLESKDCNMKHLAIDILAKTDEDRFVQVFTKMIYEEKDDNIRNSYMHYFNDIYTQTANQALEKISRELLHDTTKYKISIQAKNSFIMNESESNRRREKGIINGILPPKAKQVFLDNLVASDGIDISYISSIIMNSCTKEDIPVLKKARRKILSNLSYDATDFWRIMTNIIYVLQYE